jgi:hypothetical protein
VFFFEKKNQRTFVGLVSRKVMSALEEKFFASFFNKLVRLLVTKHHSACMKAVPKAR